MANLGGNVPEFYNAALCRLLEADQGPKVVSKRMHEMSPYVANFFLSDIGAKMQI